MQDEHQMNKERISDLYQRYLENSCTPEEHRELRSILSDPEMDGILKEVLADSYYALGAEELSDTRGNRGNEIFNYIVSQAQNRKKRRNLWPLIAAAASIVICLGTGMYFYLYRYTAPKQIVQKIQPKNDLLPGGNKAYLILSNGKKIILTGAANGKIAQQVGVTITKKADGQLVYEASANTSPAVDAEITYNTVETPRGGQYEVILPDGSHVWLNAASSLKYPTQFVASERMVELIGEAYFEVVHDSRQPFRVKTNGQVVEDIGTHFNISSYADDPASLTTLLQGGIRINNNMVLKPGEQARLAKNGSFIVKTVDVEEAVAWKNGYFMFSNESLESIMRKVCRWYNTDVIFRNEPLKQVTFSGTISKMDKVSKVLRRLELTNEVSFKIENNKIIASTAITPIN